MKLKKLLPIAAVASTAAVVAPLVTSCGIASGSFSCKMDDKGPDHYYEPKVERKAAGEAYETLDAAKKAYFEDVAKNPMIIVDDALYDMFGNYKQKNASDIEGTASLSITIKKFDAEKGTFSGSVRLKMNGVGELPINKVDNDEKVNLNLTYTYNNVPLDFKYDASSELFTKFKLVHADDETLKSDSTWTASSKGSMEMVTETEHGKDSVTYKINESFNKDYIESTVVMASALSILSIDSYYFSLQTL